MKNSNLILTLASVLSLTAFANHEAGHAETMFKQSHAEDSLGRETLSGGLMRNHEFIQENCGVGSYLFRHDVGCSKTTARLTDETRSLQSSSRTFETQPIAMEDSVYFSTNQAEVKSDHRSHLNDLASYLKENPNARVILSGYADATGTVPYNERLAARRAREVRSYLISANVPRSQISVVTPSQPVSETPNNSADRKVELQVESFLAE